MYAVAILSFLLGSVPSGVLVARALGISDPRTAGSGNIGAANLTRVGGKKAGIITFLLDFLKGLIPVVLAQIYAPEDALSGYVAALMAVSGHCYSLFLWFKGGKGVATTAGAFLPLAPLPMGLAILVWALCFFVFRISSLAAMGALIALLYFLILGSADFALILTAFACCLMVVRRHQTNLGAFLENKERRF